VVVSKGAANAFKSLVPIQGEKVVSIPNGIDLKTVRDLASRELSQEEQNIFSDPTIVAVGRLCQQKNHQLLIRIHAEIRKSGLFHRLVIIGQGDLLEELQQLTRELTVDDTVHFLGFKSNPYPFMRSATVVALTSLFEGMPIVLVEGMAVGAPIVSLDCPSGPSEVLDNGRFGVLVQLDNNDELRDSLTKIIKNSDYQEKLSGLSIEGAARFDIRKMITSWEDLLLR
jgi:glycosyltransferase involved in cell wall biosynthesis